MCYPAENVFCGLPCSFPQVEIAPGATPPAAFAAAPVVYVVYGDTGPASGREAWAYCGETESLRKRLARHQRTFGELTAQVPARQGAEEQTPPERCGQCGLQSTVVLPGILKLSTARRSERRQTCSF